MLIGAAFFQKVPMLTNDQSINRSIVSRSLDACQTMRAIERGKGVRFRVSNFEIEDQQQKNYNCGDPTEKGGQIYELILNECFPDFRPTCLADFYAIKMPNKRRAFSASSSSDSDKNSVKNLPTTTNSVSFDLTRELIDKTTSNSGAISPRGAKISMTNTGSKPNLTSALSASSLIGVYGDKLGASLKNRNRRVSFGAIRAIPSNFETISPSGTISSNIDSNHGYLEPLVLAEMNQEETNSRIASNLANHQSKNINCSKKSDNDLILVDNAMDQYVDQMLKKTIDEVLVFD